MMGSFPLRITGLAGRARLLLVASAAASITLAAAIVAISPAAAATQPHWSSAKLMPGVPGDWSVPIAVSCTGPGDCTTGGEYGTDDPYSGSLPFVATETAGKWGGARNVIDVPALGGNQYAAITSVSCAWPGNCAAVGYYLLSAALSFPGQAFVVDQVNGTWQPAHRLGGVTASVNVSALEAGWMITVSCAPATTSAARTRGLNCLAVGGANRGGHYRGFMASATHGTWGAAQLVTGLARLDSTRRSQVDAVSCAAAGTCVIGGYYTDSKGRRQSFVANEAAGTWHDALAVPGVNALNVKGSAEVDAVDCSIAGDCTAVGDYRSKSGAAEFFVVRATGGRWRDAIPMPGIARLGIGADLGSAVIAEVSCTPAACEVGGTMNTSRVDGSVGFLVGETDGRWAAPHAVPGTDTVITALSCPAPGDCTAGGTTAPGISTNGIVLDQVNGIWGKPVTVAHGNGIAAEVTALSCAATASCAAVGFLPEGIRGGPLATVATETP